MRVSVTIVTVAKQFVLNTTKFCLYILYIYNIYSIYILYTIYIIYTIYTIYILYIYTVYYIYSIHYIKNQQDATLAVLLITTARLLYMFRTAVATDLGHPYWIYINPTHNIHQWLLLEFLYSWWWTQKASETCRVILQLLINNTAKVTSCWFFVWYILKTHGNSNIKFRLYRYFYYPEGKAHAPLYCVLSVVCTI